MDSLVCADPSAATPIFLIGQEGFAEFVRALPERGRVYLSAIQFEPVTGAYALLPGSKGELASVVLIVESHEDSQRELHPIGKLPPILPKGAYRLASEPEDRSMLRRILLSWLLGFYSFDRYKSRSKFSAALIVADAQEAQRARLLAEAVGFGRDLINAPANDMGPQNLEEAALEFADSRGVEWRVTRGDELLAANFPLIHAVGRAGVQAPRLADLRWGDPAAPKVTLVGKGVCFDTGGLDIKPAKAMSLMKKDMAGAATALALARMIIDAGLRLRLRVLLPIVENATSHAAFHPGDVYRSRKGLTVEIGDTDAEGRLILADSLALAEEEEPDLLFDFATLTGAARTALGPDLPPYYTFSDALAADIDRACAVAADPVWRMPLWRPYAAMLESKIADTNNISGTAFAGSVVAALFLARFVDERREWAHFDIYGWNPTTKPGRPEGGEIQTARLLFELMEARWGK